MKRRFVIKNPRVNFFFVCIKLLIIILTPIVLLFLPGDFFDKGETICLSQLLLHTECYACGMTRACQHLIHLDFENAFAYNMLSFIVLPLLAVVWVQWFIKERKLYFIYKRQYRKDNLPKPA